MTLGMLADLNDLSAPTYGFVVMPEHFHLLVSLPNAISAARLVNILKSKAARRILPILEASVRSRHEANRTLKDRVLWQRSFRSIIIDADWAFRQKLDYIHNNPVKRGLCERPTDFRWSSAWLSEAGFAHENGLQVSACLHALGAEPPPQGVAR
jgi:REP element-mobilizing transposase RayT